jgi:hypothetical protein
MVKEIRMEPTGVCKKYNVAFCRLINEIEKLKLMER